MDNLREPSAVASCTKSLLFLPLELFALSVVGIELLGESVAGATPTVVSDAASDRRDVMERTLLMYYART